MTYETPALLTLPPAINAIQSLKAPGGPEPGPKDPGPSYEDWE